MITQLANHVRYRPSDAPDSTCSNRSEMMEKLHFTLPDMPNEGVAFNAPLLDAWLGERALGSIVQTKRNLPDGASADRFYLATPTGEAVSETDAYTLTACLCKLKDCLDQSCPPKQLLTVLSDR